MMANKAMTECNCSQVEVNSLAYARVNYIFRLQFPSVLDKNLLGFDICSTIIKNHLRCIGTGFSDGFLQPLPSWEMAS